METILVVAWILVIGTPAIVDVVAPGSSPSAESRVAPPAEQGAAILDEALGDDEARHDFAASQGLAGEPVIFEPPPEVESPGDDCGCGP